MIMYGFFRFGRYMNRGGWPGGSTSQHERWARNPILATPISGLQSRAQERGPPGPGPPASRVQDHPANVSQFNHSTDLITL